MQICVLLQESFIIRLFLFSNIYIIKKFYRVHDILILCRYLGRIIQCSCDGVFIAGIHRPSWDRMNVIDDNEHFKYFFLPNKLQFQISPREIPRCCQYNNICYLFQDKQFYDLITSEQYHGKAIKIYLIIINIKPFTHLSYYVISKRNATSIFIFIIMAFRLHSSVSKRFLSFS